MDQDNNAHGRPHRAAPDLRWQLLDDLSTAQETWGLKDRTLGVLRALLTFLPRGETLRLTVFPSNRTLSKRLLGMPESTLRRHLAKLIAAGLIDRIPSPNGKRYRVAETLAFGLDLTGLYARGQELRDQAEAMRTELRARAVLRARIREALAASDQDTPSRAEILRLLRRRLPIEALARILDTLTPSQTPETAVPAARNECHVQEKTDSVKEAERIKIAAAAIERVATMVGQTLRDERDLHRAGDAGAHFLTVHDAWTHAYRMRGVAWAVMALAYLEPRLQRLRQPDRYLRALTGRAGQGTFDLVAALGRDRAIAPT